MTAGIATDAAAWHDVECASYMADLPVWRALADEFGGPVLDIGCGTGRVAFELAAQGHEVVGVDADGELVAAFNGRVADSGLRARAHAADARTLALERRFALAILPMQVTQLLGGSTGRIAMLQAVVRHLEPQGAVALALADPFDAVPAGEARPPLPDVLEIDGWVLSSTPIAVRDEGDSVAIDRLRQAVSPAGELVEELATITLDYCAPATLEAEGRAVGLHPLAARTVPATPDYVGSTVVVMEARA
jgi:SAM-dependent methyltransferase